MGLVLGPAHLYPSLSSFLLSSFCFSLPPLASCELLEVRALAHPSVHPKPTQSLANKTTGLCLALGRNHTAFRHFLLCPSGRLGELELCLFHVTNEGTVSEKIKDKSLARGHRANNLRFYFLTLYILTSTVK